VILVFILAALPNITVFAQDAAGQNAATFTYAEGNPYLFMRTQDAYVISEILFTDGELESPEDMHLHEGVLYVADTGNRRIVALDLETRDLWVVAEGPFNRPTGVFITRDNELFVADNGNGTVFRFDLEGNLLQEITRPTDIIFGENTSFRPQRVLVDHAGIIYVVSEGTFDGIIQLTDDGEFIGFFGLTNVQLSPMEVLQNLILSDVQLARLVRRTPPTFTNMALDPRGLLRTVTQHSMPNAVMAHNVAGANILGGGHANIVGELNFVDIAVGRYGQMYAVTDTGLIYEYTQEGIYVFTFGGRAISVERSGIFTIVSAIEVDEHNSLYVLDRGRGMVHVYVPTNFAATIHSAIHLHEQGYYRESLELWRNVRREGGSLRITNLFIGRGYYQLRDYERAAYFFELAAARGWYSDAFWQIRDAWIIANFNRIIIIVFVIWLVWMTVKLLNRRLKFLPDLRPGIKRVTGIRLVADLLYIKDFIRHPIDSYYYLRNDDKGGTKAAIILMAVAYLVFLGSFLATGFLFRHFPFEVDGGYAVLYFSMLFIPGVALFVNCNYLVASITDGRGRYKDVFNLTAYAFSPYILFMPILIIVSHFLTFNEQFVMTMGSFALYTWVGVLIFIGLKEIHDFDLSVVWKNIFLTIAFAFLVVVVLFMIYMFWDNLIDMLYSLVREVGHRAIGY